MNTIKGRTVKLCTLRTRNMESTIAYESMIENDVEIVAKIHCKLCKKLLPERRTSKTKKGKY